MLRCLLCPSEFDDLKEFPKVYNEAMRAEFYDEAGRRAHTEQQDRWQQIEVVLGACGEVSIMRGHICPACANAETLRYLAISRAESPLRDFESFERRAIAFMTRTDVKPVANNVVVVSQPNVDARNARPDSGTMGIELRERSEAIAEAASAR